MSQSRLFDALFNRCREATRVLEDHYRFTENRDSLTKAIKALRHEILAIEKSLFKSIARERRVNSDVGRHNKAPTSSMRQGFHDLCDAQWSRLQETLRSLEEQLKLVNGKLAGQAEGCRYEAYALQESAKGHRAWQWPLYGLITLDLCHHPLDFVVKEMVQGGVTALQVREKNMTDKKLLAHCRKVKTLVDKYQKKQKVSLILNDRPDLAVLANYDGVHVGQADMTPKAIKKLFGSRLFVGLSTHSPKQAAAAATQGADYIGIGPVFPTKTKPHLKFIGTDFVKKMTQAASIPHTCIGGIDSNNCLEVFKAGAQGVALCTGLIQAKKPSAIAKKIIKAYT